MVAPTNTNRAVSFAGVPPDIDRTAQLPHCQDTEYAGICAQINRVFTEYQTGGNGLTLIDRKRLDLQIKSILRQLDALPDQNDLSRRVLGVVASRLGIQIYRFDCMLAGDYLKIARENQAYISQSAITSNTTHPWWENSEKYWKCFFSPKTS